MSDKIKFGLKLALALLVVLLLIWRPRINRRRNIQPIVYADVQLPRSIARLQRGIYLQIHTGTGGYYPAPKGRLQRWGDSQKMGPVYIEGVGLRDQAFRELNVGYRNSHMGRWFSAMSIELFSAGEGHLLLFWGSRACGLKVPHGAQYVVTQVPTHLIHLREFLIRPMGPQHPRGHS